MSISTTTTTLISTTAIRICAQGPPEAVGKVSRLTPARAILQSTSAAIRRPAGHLARERRDLAPRATRIRCGKVREQEHGRGLEQVRGLEQEQVRGLEQEQV